MIGFVTALHRLGRPALWFDEAASVGAIHDLTGTARQSGGTMAAYYLVLRGWAQVSTHPVWLRSLSLLLALAALALTVRLAQRWMSPGWSAATGMFLALSYLWADQAAEARSYAMALLLTVTSWMALDRLVSAPDHGRGSRVPAVAFLAAWLVLPPTHGLSVLVLAAQLAALLASRVDRMTWLRAAPGVAVGLLLTAGLTVAGAGGVTNWIPPTTVQGMVRLGQALTGPSEPVCAILAGLALLGVMRCVNRARSATTATGRFRALAPAAWGLLPVVALLILSLVKPLLVPRYLFMATPGIAMLLAMGACHLGALVEPDRRRVAQAAGIAVVTGGLLLAQVSAVVRPSSRWDQVVGILGTHSRDGDALLLPERRNRIPLEAAMRDGGSLELDPVDFPRRLGGVRYVEPERSRAATLAALLAHDRLWLVYERVFPPSSVALHRLEASRALRSYRLVRSWEIDDGIVVRRYDRR